ncbi:MAG: ribosome biogenesis GTPase Der [Myxococcales bacterium]|nr:ribosome biogenesis GTPase Der [Myxococcales bacterium]
MKPVLAIVGRPNVGKSTLFNRLTGRRLAIVDDEPGVTRDCLYADVDVEGRGAMLVDTGGFSPGAKDEIGSGVLRSIEAAIAEADVLLLVVSARDGLHPLDREVATLARRRGRPVLLVINQADPGMSFPDWEFDALGFEGVSVSALHNQGIDGLLERLGALLPEPGTVSDSDGPAGLRVCLLGRPNAGKSSLANRLLGAERQLVSAEPGTTRDAVDLHFEHQGSRYVLIDTPGVRRRSRVHKRLEVLSVMAALRTLERTDVAILVADGSEDFSEQDQRLAHLTLERGRGLIIAVNKCDLWSSTRKKAYLDTLDHALRFARFVPRFTVSARTGVGVSALLPAVAEVYSWCGKRITTGEINRFLEVATENVSPPSIKGRRARLYYLAQTNVRPPTFVCSVNNPVLVTDSYRRYLARSLRERYPYPGTPIRFIFRSHKSDDGPRRPVRKKGRKR